MSAGQAVPATGVSKISNWEKPISHNFQSFDVRHVVIIVHWMLSFHFGRKALIKIDVTHFLLHRTLARSETNGRRAGYGFIKKNLIKMISCFCHRQNTRPTRRYILLCVRRKMGRQPRMCCSFNATDNSRCVMLLCDSDTAQQYIHFNKDTEQ